MYKKLRGRIVEKYGTIKTFAHSIGMSSTAVYLKLSGRTSFDTDSIRRWCEALEIPIEDAGVYFFDF